MNYSSTSKGYPRLKIESDDAFFCMQIDRVIVEQELLVDVVEDDGVDIIVFNKIPDKEEIGTAIFVFLILNPSEIDEAKKAFHGQDNVFIYKVGQLRESVLANDIKTASNTIIAEGKSSFGITTLAKELKQEQERVNDYKVALEKSGEAQRLIMQPLFKDDAFDIKIVYEPYRDVSGDVLFVQKVYNKIFIMVADVTDHGYLAGMYGAALYALANNYVTNSSLIEQSVDMWGQYMVKASKMFQPYGLAPGDPMMVRFTANLLLCIIDLEKQRVHFTFYGSGSEPPIIISDNRVAKAVRIKEDDKIGAPVGDYDSSSPIFTKSFYPGASLILYTDGLTEIFADPTDEEKDTKKMYTSKKIVDSANMALQNNKTSSAEIVECILKDASAYSIAENLDGNTNMPNVTDDLTLMCIRWKGDYFD